MLLLVASWLFARIAWFLAMIVPSKNLRQLSETTTFGWRCRSQLLSNTPVIWVEAMPESCFENSRMVDDELWGTALVDGDGSTNTLVACSCSLLHGSSLE
jgi:hypothetical protein